MRNIAEWMGKFDKYIFSIDIYLKQWSKIVPKETHILSKFVEKKFTDLCYNMR